MRARAVPLRVAVLGALLALGGCAGAPRTVEPPPAPVPAPEPVAPVDAGRQLVEVATRQLGVPYRRGGADPQGFDCSGLVQYAHQALGLRVPRTAAEQRAFASPVERDELRAGDLVFFRVGGEAVDHVGIYAGDGRFLHAPRTGRPVGYDRLDDAWFATRFVGGGRFWTAPSPPAAPSQAP